MTNPTPPTTPAPCCSHCSGSGHRTAPRAASSHVFIGLPTGTTLGQAARPRARHSFLGDAFRPFYLGGAIFAALAIPLWLGTWYHGYFPPSLIPLYWHTHEMVFGFASAIIVGFLFTAARNWTGLPLPAGVPLALIFGLWVAARFGMYFAYGPAVAVLDSLVLFIVAGVLAHKFIRARSVRNMPLVAVLSLLATSNASFHASMFDLIALSPLAAAEIGLMLIVLVEMIVGGRVVPGFTASAFPGVRQLRSPVLHNACLILAALAFAADAIGLPTLVRAGLAGTAGVAVLIQALGWNPLASRSRPMVFVLHLSHAWIPVGLVLLGLSAAGIVPRSSAIHALAVGSIAGLILSMITRTALGHSDRPIRAGGREIAMFVCVQIAAILRVVAALVPAFYVWGMASSGLAWLVAFSLYALFYAPILLGARPTAPGAARGVAAAST